MVLGHWLVVETVIVYVVGNGRHTSAVVLTVSHRHYQMEEKLEMSRKNDKYLIHDSTYKFACSAHVLG